MSTSKYAIQKVAVLGSGTMGSQIAAHCVNAGLDVWLLDLKDEESDHPNQQVIDSIKKLKKMNPSPLGLPEYADRIKAGNFTDDLDVLGEVDWVCEAIIEKMDIKKQMMSDIEDVRKKGTIVSSNTSGLPIGKISEDCSDEFKQHFLGTHFFNPPRYMKLLEVIPTESTADEVTEYMSRFCEQDLGKGVVQCKDTPNFIANRIGIFSMANLMPYFFEGSFRAEEIDFLLGTLTGYSKAATFRTADMSGLDVIHHVASNLYPAIPDDECREVFDLPDIFEQMVEEGKHGNKAGEGFYKKVKTETGKEYKVINPETGEYESQIDPEFESASEAEKKFDSPEERLRFLVNQDDKIGQFLWDIHRDLLLYSANRIPEITDSVEAIDRAMKWGFNWQLGPFERWDAIGVPESVERMQDEGIEVPESVLNMIERGRHQFYDYEKGTVYNLAIGEAQELSPPAEGAIQVSALKANDKEVFGNESAGLYDMGEGIALFEFRTRKYTLGFELVQSLDKACNIVEDQFDALVISHDGDNFTYGANLMEAMQTWQKGDKKRVREAAKNFQDVAVGLRYRPFPVVIAPFGRSLGGGVEFVLHADKVIAHHELYAGLVEVGVGLLPAGGGTKEILYRTMQQLMEDEQTDPMPNIKEKFKTIGMAKVSDGAPKAKKMGYLRESDQVVMNRDLLIANAKAEALRMADAGYHPPVKPQIKVLGKQALSSLKMMLHIMHEANFITDYDKVVAEKVAYVMSGGDLSEPQEVPEDYILRLERKAFIELLEDERTQARIEHMLKKGKPLRN
ncbi:3-hydroxyacyl-CoA dehydrogenase/enoyl-CoA hydratase family protein [Aliifodinibius salicampi]|uniref:3-hydroxyacyl-CoA dehydrogenase/enoyl-CoA hydratase family protein n=1 Tax=Fodinibius salicampi TaxID=1920655 RepID=A0ABT3PTY9_9BACT|nr:3-hydroxyacyl-CoA dehydrogenase/enoyl-CoA hydratase family protein [Fodinibius salicampi]MCW9711316.1 3-hydroxyacyl-CoA dehydrogenase/enoyl-CoA hydratase family protein [Fodinibius salicampi]